MNCGGCLSSAGGGVPIFIGTEVDVNSVNNNMQTTENSTEKFDSNSYLNMELLRFTTRRTTLCKYSVFLRNSKIDDWVYAKCEQNLPSALFNQRRRSCSFSSSHCIRRFRRSRNLSRK